MALIDRERWSEIEPLLDRALELDESDRAQWLDHLRTESPELAAELTAFLAEDALAEGFGFLAEPLEVTLAGRTFGAYTLERPLGHGGMGHVWLARRTDGQFEGHAAVKLLNLALLSVAGRARFRREGSLLARLTHPGIARLLDAGVAEGGQPYLVLEHVAGARIDEYADAHGLGVAERIGLALQVLAAVGHAHANLIVHRDLKPSNILVTPEGTAKLLDFGIAKLLPGDAGPAETELTRVAGQALTPEYAAPEQLRGTPITTATDVYAVGVLLYVLLTGRRPFDLAGRSPAEVEHLVCETEPPRPSDAFAPGADGASGRAGLMGSTPDRLRRQLRGDLDAIVLQALRKEPERRYATAGALAEELERYLDNRPVLARPEGAAYRTWKFVRRHRGAVALSAIAAALLVGAGLRERALRARAQSEARTATAVEQYLESVFRVSDPYAQPSPQDRDVKASVLLDRGGARLDSALAGEPAVRSHLRLVFARVYEHLGKTDRAAAMLERALADARTAYGPRHAVVAAIMAELGNVRGNQDRMAEAETLIRAALAQREQLLGDRDTATASSLADLAGFVGIVKQQYHPADSLLRAALRIQRTTLGDTSLVVAENMANLATILRMEGKPQESEPLFRQALAIQNRELGRDHPYTTITMNNLGLVDVALGHYADAEALDRRVLAIQRRTFGDHNPQVPISLGNLGSVIAHDHRRLSESEALLRQALELTRQTDGEKQRMTGSEMEALAGVLIEEGKFDEALTLLRRSLDIYHAAYGKQHPLIAGDLVYLGVISFRRGNPRAAIPLLQEALRMSSDPGSTRPPFMIARLTLAGALRDQGETRQAAPLFRDAIAQLDTMTTPPRRAQLAVAEIGLGRTLLDQGQVADARLMLDRGLALARAISPPDDATTAEGLLGSEACLLAQGRTAEAEQALQDADRLLRPLRNAQPRLALQLEAVRGLRRRLPVRSVLAQQTAVKQ